jgi:predicted RNA-binding protein YlxR (DUF448 family)
MSEPVRTCVGCGRRAAQSTLVRFASVKGHVARGRAVPGRGAYTCRSAACFGQATSRRAFTRALRAPVIVPVDLGSRFTDAHYTGALDG